MNPPVYLASASPRRRELLAQLGLDCRVVAVDVDETPRPAEPAPDYVLRLAVAKAEAARGAHGLGPGDVVLAADTAVVVDGAILGKPADADDARRMLTRLSAREHEVLTGVAVRGGARGGTALSVSRVRFRALAPAEIDAYWASGEPADKAGAYAIQGCGALFVEHLSGSYSGVVGLPIYETGQLLAAAGVPLLGRPR